MFVWKQAHGDRLILCWEQQSLPKIWTLNIQALHSVCFIETPTTVWTKPYVTCPQPSGTWEVGTNSEAVIEPLLKGGMLLAKELAVLNIYCQEKLSSAQLKPTKEQCAVEKKNKVLALFLSQYLKCKGGTRQSKGLKPSKKSKKTQHGLRCFCQMWMLSV